MESELTSRLEEQGMQLDHYLESLKKSKDELLKEWRPQADKRVRTGLILRELAKQEAIVPNEEDIIAEVDRQLLRYQAHPEMANYFRSDEYRDYVTGVLKNRAVFGLLRGWASEKAKRA